MENLNVLNLIGYDKLFKNLLIKSNYINKIKIDFIVVSPGINIKKCHLKKFLEKNFQKIITDLDVYLSFAYPPMIAPIKAVIFMSIDSTSKSLISKLNTPTANIPPITIMAFKPSA